MNIREYFSARNFRKPKPAEVAVFGLPMPLPVGWISMNGEGDVTDAMLHRIKTFHLLPKDPKPIGNTVRQSKVKKQKKKRAQTKVATINPVKPLTYPSEGFMVEGVDVRSADFLRTWAWRELRYATIKRFGAVCLCCGATPRTTSEQIQVDHIKPRSLFPHLAMDPENLQTLCGPCNQGKSNKDFTDWR